MSRQQIKHFGIFFKKKSKISEIYYYIWNHHGKLIQISTNMPSFGSVFREIQFEMLTILTFFFIKRQRPRVRCYVDARIIDDNHSVTMPWRRLNASPEPWLSVNIGSYHLSPRDYQTRY